MSDFENGQTFVVTGASSGIGEGTALMLNENGAKVVGIARRADKLEEVKSKAKYPENFFCETKDLTVDMENLPAYMKSLKDKYGKFSGMAYCAGVGFIKPLQVISMSDIKRIFDINYFAPVFMAKGMLDRRTNIGKGTSLVLISSISALLCDSGMVSYSGSKAALIASMKSAAREVAPSGVRINTISPTDIKTPMTSSPEYLEKRSHLYPMGMGEVSDAANLICFLLSNKSKWITGQNYILDCAFF